jgi:hypothetical protein
MMKKTFVVFTVVVAGVLVVTACAQGHVKSNYLCNLGYGHPSTLFPRLLPFNEACSLL